jgi:hypothetical protein
MTAGQIALLVLLLIVVVAAGVLVGMAMRRRELQRRFGPEYDRTVEESESRLAADRELINREKRHGQLALREIEPAARQRYAEQWRAVQAQFIDDPAGAVVAGDELVTRLVSDRGYPTEDYDEQLSVLSVEHARTLGSYRDAHGIYLKSQDGEATTEDLRQALVHYRAIFADILGEQPSDIVERAGVETTVADSTTNADPSDTTDSGHTAVRR